MKNSVKIIIAIAIVVAVGAGAGTYLFNKKVPGLEDVEAEYSMTADELFDAFDTNEMEAVKQYEGKVIAVSGVVSNVKNTDSTSNVVLKAENAMAGGINCSFNHPANNLKAGDNITVKGRCQGFLMDVILNNCVKE